MKRFLAILSFCTIFATAVHAQVWVPGHTTKSGKFVQGHFRKETARSTPGDRKTYREHEGRNGTMVNPHTDVTSDEWVPEHRTKKGNLIPSHYRKKHERN